MESRVSPPSELLEQLNLVIVLLNRDGVITYVNQQANVLFEQSRRKLLGQSLFQIPAYHNFPIERLEHLWSTEQGFVDHDIEWEFVDGRKIITDLTADLIIIEGEKFCALQIKHEDPFRKFSQERKHKHQISASRHLIRGLAHEIKNPLGGIRGAAQLLNRNLATDELREYTQMIIEQADRLRDLVDRLLGPNKLPQRKPTNIHNVINRVINVCNANKQGAIKIQTDFDPSLPELFVDADQIEQAILNLVNNAVQAAELSESVPQVIIQTRFVGNKVMHEKQFKKVMRVSVIDNGPGIQEGLKETLFYPMVTSKSDGNGLGLSISQTLVDQHSGLIEFESRAGQTQFSIFLPQLNLGE